MTKTFCSECGNQFETKTTMCNESIVLILILTVFVGYMIFALLRYLGKV